MVGLSVILENYGDLSTKPCPQVISKAVIQRKPPPVLPSFLDHCSLCRQKLSPGKDIYMYKGDKGFCSEECRWRQIFMDEEEGGCTTREYNCSLAATSSRPASSSGPSTRSGKGRRRNAFAY